MQDVRIHAHRNGFGFARGYVWRRHGIRELFVQGSRRMRWFGLQGLTFLAGPVFGLEAGFRVIGGGHGRQN